MKYTLEASRLFPYIAWVLVIGFAFFTYALTIHVRAELSDIDTGLERYENLDDDARITG